MQLTIHFIPREVKNIASLGLQNPWQHPCSTPSSWAGFYRQKNTVDIILFPETLPICRTQSMNQHSMGTQTCILVCLGHSTKCQAEDKARRWWGMSSSTAKPSPQFNTPAESERQCQGEIRKQGFASKRHARVLISFPPDCRLKGKIQVNILKYFPKWKFWNIPRWKFFLFTLLWGPKNQNKTESE